ncbi:uncharacterized protein PFL1_02269 [Pseudozyma flocculosa PF-1]|uniref:uncharacterized protein n=1 Tax=Pseudozyma flocculosa PF-1 TaxID=1277687 RepID=UPI0004560274|nr:uncharacterized protein PFL1_02269 [Pseudozyma flocculosa PF-1]EPQ30152.1 hypothetical protein PFL1_02269 [Pseudozyma flocculosa PF-1]
MSSTDNSRIQELDGPTRGSLRASLVLLSPARIVEELVRNSISACARRSGQPPGPDQSLAGADRSVAGTIVVAIDFRTWSITVRDDGIGFPSTSALALAPPRAHTATDGPTLKLVSFLGLVRIRYMPSSADGAPTWNVQRTDISCVVKDGVVLFEGPTPTLSPRAHVIHGVEEDAAELGQPRLLSTRGGSTVVVHDIFGQIPVRRKALRTLAAQKKEVDRTKARIEELGLLQPGIAFRLHATYAMPSLPSDPTSVVPAQTDRREEERLVLSLPKTNSLADRFGDIHGSQLIRPRRLQEIEIHQNFLLAGVKDRRPQTAVTIGSTAAANSRVSSRREVNVVIDGFFSTWPYEAAGPSAQRLFFNHECLPPLSRGSRGIGDVPVDGFDDHFGPLPRSLSAELNKYGLLDDSHQPLLERGEKRPRTSGAMPASTTFANPQDAHKALASIFRQKLEALGKLVDDHQVAYLVRIRVEPVGANRTGTPAKHRLSFGALIKAVEASILGPAASKADDKYTAHEGKRTSPLDATATTSRKRLKTIGPGAAGNAGSARSSARYEAPPAPAGMIVWTDPLTQRRYFVDGRTGTSYPADYPRSTVLQRPSSSPSNTTSRRQRPMSSRPSTADRTRLAKEAVAIGHEPDRPQWLRATLSGWTNPAFDTTLPRHDGGEVPTLNRDHPRRPTSTRGASTMDAVSTALRAGGVDEDVYAAPSPSSSPRKRSDRKESRFFIARQQSGTRTGRLRPPGASSASAASAAVLAPPQQRTGTGSTFADVESAIPHSSLRRAHVIGQVDEKFIACLLDLSLPTEDSVADMAGRPGLMRCGDGSRTAASPLLVCIDQHAADERVRYERFLAEYVAGCLAGAIASVPIRQDDEVLVSLDQDLVEALSYRFEDVDVTIQQELTFWGFEVGKIDSRAAGQRSAARTVTVEIRSIPEVWSDKVLKRDGRSLAEREEVREVVRSHLVALSHRPEGSLGEGPTTNDEAASVVIAQRVPRKVREWIASKACRSAISEWAISFCLSLVFLFRPSDRGLT